MYCALAVITALIVRTQPEVSLAGPSAAVLVAELAVGALLVVPALAAPGNTRFGLLLAAVALTWPLGEWNTPTAQAAFTAGLVLSLAWPVLLTAAALRGVDERPLGLGAMAVVAAATLTNVGVLGVLSAAVFDPRAQGCGSCPANPLLIAGDAGTWHHVGQAGLVLAASWTAAFAACSGGHAGTRLARAPGRNRARARPGRRSRAAVRRRCSAWQLARIRLRRSDRPRAVRRRSPRSRWSRWASLGADGARDARVARSPAW